MSDLLPCPFCGAGETQIVENGKVWAGMKYSEPTSVSVRHWCADVAGQPKRMLERVGRDGPSAIAAWNRRRTESLDARTIEACARVAERAYAGDAGERCAAAIRALSPPQIDGEAK